MICTTCGLPKELCICETISKEERKVQISTVQKRFKKRATLIKGIDVAKIDVKELMKKLKSELACGGTYKYDAIELQGDHKARVKKILIKEGFPENLIEVV